MQLNPASNSRSNKRIFNANHKATLANQGVGWVEIIDDAMWATELSTLSLD